MEKRWAGTRFGEQGRVPDHVTSASLISRLDLSAKARFKWKNDVISFTFLKFDCSIKIAAENLDQKNQGKEAL